MNITRTNIYLFKSHIRTKYNKETENHENMTEEEKYKPIKAEQRERESFHGLKHLLSIMFFFCCCCCFVCVFIYLFIYCTARKMSQFLLCAVVVFLGQLLLVC